MHSRIVIAHTMRSEPVNALVDGWVSQNRNAPVGVVALRTRTGAVRTPTSCAGVPDTVKMRSDCSIAAVPVWPDRPGRPAAQA